MATTAQTIQATLGQPRLAVSGSITEADTGNTVQCVEIPAGAFVPPNGVTVYIAEVFAGGSPLLDVGDGTNTDAWVDQTENTATTVGTTRTLLWTFGNATSAIGPLGTSDSGESLIIPDKFPYDVVIPAGYRLRTVTTGGDAADTYTGIFIQVEEWDAS